MTTNLLPRLPWCAESDPAFLGFTRQGLAILADETLDGAYLTERTCDGWLSACVAVRNGDTARFCY